MSKPRLLDLFAGAGGAARGYQRAGFYVVGVDIEPQPNYAGDEFVQDDALRLMSMYPWWDEPPFDAIHASPPCQAYCNLGRGDEHPRLIEPLRPLLEATGLPYVIENVVGAPLHNPIMLCGSSFGLGVRRHRLFESNYPLMALPCAHGQQARKYRVYQRGRWYLSPVAHVWGTGGGKAREQWGDAMGIDWMTDRELAEAIPPAFTELIGNQLLTQLQKAAA